MTEKKKSFYCYILRLNSKLFRKENWTDRDTELVGYHLSYLKSYVEKEILFMAGRTINDPVTERDLGIAIFETGTEEEAKGIMENDPAVKGKLMTAELFKFSLASARK